MPGYRGRLLQTFLAEVARLSTATSTFDPVFREPVVTYPGGVRTTGRAELAPTILVRCQVEPAQVAAQVQTPAGNTPKTRIVTVFHFRDLERAGLIDPDGQPAIKVNCRLVSLKTVKGEAIQPLSPTVFCTEATPQFGLGRSRNLLICTWEDRQQGVAS